MTIRRQLVIIIIVLFQLNSCISTFHSVKEKRNKNYREGVELFNQKKYHEAIDRFEIVVEIDPQYQDAGRYLTKSKKLLKLQERKIKQKANVNYDRGVALMKRGQYDAALAYLLQAVREDPDVVDADDKIDECRKKLAPKFNQTLKAAEWQYKQKQYAAAYRLYLRAKTYNPSSLEVSQLKNKIEDKLDEKARKFRIKGKEYFSKKQYIAAKQQFQLALGNHPWDKESKELLDKTNNILNLDNYYNNAVKIYNSGNYFGAKSAFLAVNNIAPGYKATEQYLNRINAMLTSQVPTLYNNGVVLYEKEDYKAAIAEFNKVLSIAPGHAMALEYRQRALSKLELKKSLEEAH